MNYCARSSTRRPPGHGAAPPALFASLIALSGCGFGDALDSNPEAWDPPASTAQASGGSAGAPPRELPPECDDPQPSAPPGAEQSGPELLSHLPGSACLEGCHEPGGSARSAFDAAGTVYVSEGSMQVASPGGSVQGVGGSVLSLDRCGNFWARPAVLATEPRFTQPFVANPTLRRMQKPLIRVPSPGDCNQSGCHDFSGRQKLGIYY